LKLSGYGVELQFKSTEYVAQDDSGLSGKTKNDDLFIISTNTVMSSENYN